MIVKNKYKSLVFEVIYSVVLGLFSVGVILQEIMCYFDELCFGSVVIF